MYPVQRLTERGGSGRALPEKLAALLRKREFLSVATSDSGGVPNAAPKFVLKTEGRYIYLVDYTIGRTFENLKANPRISLSLTDPKTLFGYQINGSVAIIERGKALAAARTELLRRRIGLTAEHIIAEVRGTERHEAFELAMPEKFVVFKVAVTEIIEIYPTGGVARSRMQP